MMTQGEQLYFGGEIYTVDETRPTAEAVSVKDGRIVAVGSKKECQAALGKNHETVDLNGGALLPGFIDTHLHPLLLVYFDLNVDLHDIDTIKALQDKIRDTAKRKDKDSWIIGLQLDDHSLRDARLPNRHDIDTACSDRPVLIVAFDGHRVITNTQAIEAAGMTAATPDPAGGLIDRESDGYPTGVFRETAAHFMMGKMPPPSMDLFINGAAESFRKIAARGITSIGVVLQTDEEGPSGPQGALELAGMELLLGQMPANVYCMLIAHDVNQILAAQKTGLHSQEAGSHHIGGLKIYSDGTFQALTAYMKEPYADQPDKRGILTLEREEIYRRMVEGHKAGLQLAIHAIGDAANQTCIDLYDRLLKEYPRKDHRHRLEHASQLDAGMIDAIVRLGLVVSTQPLFIHQEKKWLHKRMGRERVPWTYAFRSLVDAGVKVAGASDGPITSGDVLHAIQCCITREGFEPQQGLTAAQAVRMFTLDAAYAQFEDTVKGSLSVGKRADMVILSANPVAVPIEKIRDIRVRRTICGGKVVFEE
jgi:predicted amidohydrolase YtcJ